MTPSDEEIGRLVGRANAGDRKALDELFAAAYPDLKRIARSRLWHGGRSTMMNTTAVVHETFVRACGGGQLRAESRAAFLAYASQVARSVIIDAIREKQAQRRGGDQEKLTLTTEVIGELSGDEDLVLEIHEALQELKAVDERLSTVVEMRYFGGFTEQEIGEALGVEERTVRRLWVKARLILKEMLPDRGQHSQT